MKELKALRKQYDRRIDICIGLEIEYLPEYRSYYEMLHELLMLSTTFQERRIFLHLHMML